VADRQVSKLPIDCSKIGFSVLIALLLVCSAICQAAGFYDRAEEAAFARRYDEAIELYKQSMASEPDKAATAAYQLFNLFKRLRRYDEAAQYLKDFEKITGDQHLSQDLADLYRDAGRHYEAQSIYQQILAQHPDDSAALYGMGISLEATGNYSLARDYYNRLTSDGGTYASQAQRRLNGMTGAESAQIDNDVEIGRWPSRSISVYIADGSNVTGYRSEMYQMATQAVSAWGNALVGTLNLSLVNDPSTADIELGWVRAIRGALGVTAPEKTTDGRLVHAKILISVGVDSNGRYLATESTATRQLYEAQDRMLREVLLHELGHALGLHHSPRADDIMANGIYGLTSSDRPTDRELQQNDIARVVALYSEKGPGQSNTATTPNVATGGADSPAAAVLGIRTRPQATPPGPTQSSPDPALRMAPELSEAMVDLQEGRYEASKDCLTTAINRNPKNATAHYLMAITLVNLRQYDEAAKQYREVLKLAPTGRLAKRASDGLAKVTARATP
jgi:tetratricopeptide (TPR) repeat protein